MSSPPAPFSHIRSPFSGYSVAFSPFHRNLLAVASSQYYGIAGNGRVSIVNIDNGQSVCEFMTRDGCFDVAWSEKHDQIIAAATGDGSVKLFSISATQDPGRPLAALVGHTAETYSVNWNLFNRDRVCTASWDRTVRVWDISTAQCIMTLAHHSAIAYEAKWNPRCDNILASVGGDGDLVVQDTRQPNVPQARIRAHDNEILCLDWNKYREYTIATGSVDRSIRVWDVRKGGSPVNVLTGHELAVRRLQFSPHSDSMLASCSYDMTVKVWSIGDRMTRSLIDTYDHHTEFVVGLDYSNFHRDLLASTGWDRLVAVWTVGSVRRPGGKIPKGSQVVHDRRIRQSAA